MAENTLEIGQYRVEKKLGEGGMGAVYLGVHKVLGSRAAIKTILQSSLDDEEAVTRLMDEGRALGSLRHPNIVGVLDFFTEGDRHYLIMEYVHGEPLDKQLKRQQLTIEEALDLALKIGGGLAAAHKKNVLHRDIKPANVMISDEGEVKVMDFGLAKFSGASTKTKTGMVVGTPRYMSPEQVRGQSVDARTDQYAFGVLVYRLLCGREPFNSGDSMAIMFAQVNDPPPPLMQWNTGVPPTLQAAVLRSLAKNADDRYPDMAAMLLDIDRALQTVGAAGMNPTMALPHMGGAEATQKTATPDASSGAATQAAGAMTSGGAATQISGGIAASGAATQLNAAPQSASAPTQLNQAMDSGATPRFNPAAGSAPTQLNQRAVQSGTMKGAPTTPVESTMPIAAARPKSSSGPLKLIMFLGILVILTGGSLGVWYWKHRSGASGAVSSAAAAAPGDSPVLAEAAKQIESGSAATALDKLKAAGLQNDNGRGRELYVQALAAMEEWQQITRFIGEQDPAQITEKFTHYEFYNLGQAWLNLKKFDFAAHAFQKSLAKKSDFAPAQQNLGLALFALNDPEGAKLHLRMAQKIDPALPQPWFLLGKILEKEGDKPGAKENYSEAAKRAKDPAQKAQYESLAEAMK